MRRAAISTGGTIRKLRVGNGQGYWYYRSVADITKTSAPNSSYIYMALSAA